MAENVANFTRDLLANPHLEIPQDLKEERAELDKLLESSRYFRTNVYRQLSRDACAVRHAIIEPQTLQMYCPLVNGRLSKQKPEAAGSRGLFSRLPLGLIEIIFVDMMDLATLTKARCILICASIFPCPRLLGTLTAVSRGIRLIISSLPYYNTVLAQAPASLRAVISLGAAEWTSCRDLHDQLCKPGLR